MKKLTQKQMLNLVLTDLSNWVSQGDSDVLMAYAFNNGYKLHAANLWLSSGACSNNILKQVKNIKISHRSEMNEISQLCKQAFIYICPDCNHHAFLDDDNGNSIDCQSCLKTCLKKEI